MLEQGVIKSSSSPWASPIVLVKKKDGKYHFWQISVDPQDQEKTAFVTPDGLWEFVRLPFGVTGGPGSFQRAIEIVLSGLTYDTCLCYFDDIIIPSNSIEQQCERLRTVLSRFRTHNLRVRVSKCTFAADEVLFLGHIVSSKGFHTDPAKIKAVSELQEPKNVVQVRTFLGLAGYHRRFIPRFATIAAPLVDLTKICLNFSGIKGTKRHSTHLRLCFVKLLF